MDGFRAASTEVGPSAGRIPERADHEPGFWRTRERVVARLAVCPRTLKVLRSAGGREYRAYLPAVLAALTRAGVVVIVAPFARLKVERLALVETTQPGICRPTASGLDHGGRGR